MPVSPTVHEKLMAKKKPKVTLYADIDERIKRRLERAAEATGRKLNKQVEILLSEALDRFEEDEGMPDIDQPEGK